MTVKCRFVCGIVPWEKDERTGEVFWPLLQYRFSWDGSVLWLHGNGKRDPLFAVQVCELAIEWSIGYVAGRALDLFVSETIEVRP